MGGASLIYQFWPSVIQRITALVLCRSAWLDRPQAEFNRHAYIEIADLLESYPPETAAARYTQTRTYQTVRDISRRCLHRA